MIELLLVFFLVMLCFLFETIVYGWNIPIGRYILDEEMNAYEIKFNFSRIQLSDKCFDCMLLSNERFNIGKE